MHLPWTTQGRKKEEMGMGNRNHTAELPGFRRVYGVDLQPGQRFRYTVVLRDKKGYRIGYGPGGTLHTMGEGYRDERGGLVLGGHSVYIQD